MAPGFPSSLKRVPMALPTRFTPRTTSGGIRGLTGSANGGMKILAGQGAVWCWFSTICGYHRL